jgi:hypothetical protein
MLEETTRYFGMTLAAFQVLRVASIHMPNIANKPPVDAPLSGEDKNQPQNPVQPQRCPDISFERYLISRNLHYRNHANRLSVQSRQRPESGTSALFSAESFTELNDRPQVMPDAVDASILEASIVYSCRLSNGKAKRRV